MGQSITQIRTHRQRAASSEGFSLLEVIVATSILATGMLSLAAFMTFSLRAASGSSYAVLAREKAREAVESVHTARDTGRLTWAKIQNKSKTGGIFKDEFTTLKVAGADGIVNTDDDGAVEELRTPGPDGTLGNSDDLRQVLSNFERQITISNLFRDGSTTLINPNLRQITVTIRYTMQGLTKTYAITTYVSSFS